MTYQNAIDEMEQIATKMDNLYDNILLCEHGSIQSYGHAVSSLVARFHVLADYIEVPTYCSIATMAGEHISTAILQAALLDDAAHGICGVWWGDYPDNLCRTFAELDDYHNIAISNSMLRCKRDMRMKSQ